MYEHKEQLDPVFSIHTNMALSPSVNWTALLHDEPQPIVNEVTFTELHHVSFATIAILFLITVGLISILAYVLKKQGLYSKISFFPVPANDTTHTTNQENTTQDTELTLT